MSILSSRDWLATESTDPTGGDRKLVVTGDVEMSLSNELPRLREAVPQGINPKILILELYVETIGDVGSDVVTWQPTSFEKPVTEHQYTQVEISGQKLVDVELVHS